MTAFILLCIFFLILSQVFWVVVVGKIILRIDDLSGVVIDNGIKMGVPVYEKDGSE